jgi:hypothetical protein
LKLVRADEKAGDEINVRSIDSFKEKQMIPISTYNLLVAVFVIFVLYSLIDYKNKFYANIASAIIASLFGIYLAAMIYLGAVEYSDGTVISDLSVAIIILIPTVGVMAYSYFMAYDAYTEATEETQ